MQVGDEVVIMSAPGVFRVIAIDGRVVTIENADGVRKTVRDTTLRTVTRAAR